jgi:hypothetical protein
MAFTLLGSAIRIPRIANNNPILGIITNASNTGMLFQGTNGHIWWQEVDGTQVDLQALAPSGGVQSVSVNLVNGTAAYTVPALTGATIVSMSGDGGQTPYVVQGAGAQFTLVGDLLTLSTVPDHNNVLIITYYV